MVAVLRIRSSLRTRTRKSTNRKFCKSVIARTSPCKAPRRTRIKSYLQGWLIYSCI
jgi:hypothetical protein